MDQELSGGMGFATLLPLEKEAVARQINPVVDMGFTVMEKWEAARIALACVDYRNQQEPPHPWWKK